MTPEYLKRWTLPSSYAGAHWPDYYSFLGRSRDSGALERANFDAGLKAIGGEKSEGEDPHDPDSALCLVRIVRENHWAVGWVEWIAIHESNTEALTIADKIKEGLEDYPVVDEELWSNYEQEEATDTWRDCYNDKERLSYIRDHRSQFEFYNYRELIDCVRGKHFCGYASELLH